MEHITLKEMFDILIDCILNSNLSSGLLSFHKEILTHKQYEKNCYRLENN